MPGEWPAEPWDLRGRGWLTVWTAPRSAISLPSPDVVPLTLFGRVVVVSAFVDYQPPGVLAYHELMAAVLVRRGARPGLSILDIWVDDTTSQRGARAMWAIPKVLAGFTFSPEPLAATAHDDELIAAADETRGSSRTFPVRLTTSVWQFRRGQALRTELRTSARAGLTRLRWRITPGGELGWLNAAKPRLHLFVTDLHMRFGSP
ncbi:Acetoacetate decarboxylase (ADC) [Lentzea waywayandensis]|uniref:Acetoacetate decarboxylase (ADC) n=1 Tax=Lentzea waywayandensis TaxID=84724 RepID=A0A1I6DF51_9PSEU|nr:acetoacetate decarboxylase family protein [Lentzea waywayandensis]SFR04079.1 Acetoacetate decarboxylase (ADC) [Lentzea waywayandensis]